MGDLDRPNIGYDALRSVGNYWRMRTVGNYDLIYADAGLVRRYYAQSTSDRMIVYGYWTSYDDVVEWVRLQQPVQNGDGNGNGDGQVPKVNAVAVVGAVALLVGVGYVLYRLFKRKRGKRK